MLRYDGKVKGKVTYSFGLYQPCSSSEVNEQAVWKNLALFLISSSMWLLGPNRLRP